MEDQWIVRVEGTEYGPVETDVLREWKREGRLIPTNEVRRVLDHHWTQAGELSDVFADPESTAAVPPPLPPQDFERPRTWREILTETFRIYRAGFIRLMFFGILTSLPMFFLQLSLPKFALPDLTSGVPANIAPPQVQPISWVLLCVLIIAWPISTAGFQFVADDILRRRSNSFAAQFSTALRYWTRVLMAALFVYGSYFFWLVIPFSTLVAFVNSTNPFLALLAVLLIGGFLVYMVSRLFINFLFWQETVTIGNYPPLLSIRESKELARSVPQMPRFDRPLYRGAIIASAWLLLLLVLTFCAELPFAIVRFVGVTPEEGMALMRKMSEAQTPDALMMAANITAATINLLLHPLLAVAFVVLYYDAKARSGRKNENELGPS